MFPECHVFGTGCLETPAGDESTKVCDAKPRGLNGGRALWEQRGVLERRGPLGSTAAVRAEGAL